MAWNVIIDETGSIVVTITIDGTTYDLNTTLFSICDDIESQTPFNFSSTTMYLSSYMVVDGVSYYGVTCAQKSSTEKTQSLHPAIYAAIGVASVLILVALIIILWKCKACHKTKTHDNDKIRYLGDYQKTFERQLFFENSFTSLRGKMISPPPLGTQLSAKYPKRIRSPLNRIQVTPQPHSLY